MYGEWGKEKMKGKGEGGSWRVERKEEDGGHRRRHCFSSLLFIPPSSSMLHFD